MSSTRHTSYQLMQVHVAIFGGV